MLDLNRILGASKPHNDRSLLGPAPTTTWSPVEGSVPGTFERVLAHSEPGCCPAHDRLRREKRERIS